MNNENLTFFNLNHHFCRHRNDGLYDFVLFVQYAKQEIPQRAVKQRKFWRFNVVVVYCNLLFLLLFGTFWYTLRRSRTPNQKFANKAWKPQKTQYPHHTNAPSYCTLLPYSTCRLPGQIILLVLSTGIITSVFLSLSQA